MRSRPDRRILRLHFETGSWAQRRQAGSSRSHCQHNPAGSSGCSPCTLRGQVGLLPARARSSGGPAGPCFQPTWLSPGSLPNQETQARGAETQGPRGAIPGPRRPPWLARGPTSRQPVEGRWALAPGGVAGGVYALCRMRAPDPRKCPRGGALSRGCTYLYPWGGSGRGCEAKRGRKSKKYSGRREVGGYTAESRELGETRVLG